jgi:hypothetical protein
MVVMPAQAGIQFGALCMFCLDPGFRRGDGNGFYYFSVLCGLCGRF